MNGLRSEALSPSHDREGFSCGVAALDNYLQRQASQDMRRHVAAVFVMVGEGQPRTILGYYTLASYAVETSGLPDGTARKLPRYPTTPATLIGRLARAIDCPGLGSLLLADALGRILANTREVASALVVVDAKDDSAEAFYRKHGFIPFGGSARKLFLPMNHQQPGDNRNSGSLRSVVVGPKSAWKNSGSIRNFQADSKPGSGRLLK